jgi:hypothetical protein
MAARSSGHAEFATFGADASWVARNRQRIAANMATPFTVSRLQFAFLRTSYWSSSLISSREFAAIVTIG